MDNQGQITGRIDPETGTTKDAVTGKDHRCGADSTRADDPSDYVAAEQTMRQEANANIGDHDVVTVRKSLESLYGADHQDRVSGYRLEPSKGYGATDFTDGDMRATYERSGDSLRLVTMYPEPKRDG
jgi:hypothetical protein